MLEAHYCTNWAEVQVICDTIWVDM